MFRCLFMEVQLNARCEVQMTMCLLVRCQQIVVEHDLMAEWSRAVQLSSCCRSPLPGFESRPGNVRKLLVT